MKLQFNYQMNIVYSKPVRKCHFTIKCIPKDTARQKLIDYEISMHSDTTYSYGEDSYGNRTIYGRMDEQHHEFTFQIKGNIEVKDIPYEEEAKEGRIGMYRYPSGKCIPGKELTKYYQQLTLEGVTAPKELPEPEELTAPAKSDSKSNQEENAIPASGYIKNEAIKKSASSNTIRSATDKSMESQNLTTSIAIMHRLYQDFTYEKYATNVTTDAENAWKQGKGVCQDYAHIFITLLRMAGIPARYVCGLFIGEGESHAWVEVLCNGKWIGLDPTNDCMVGQNYIKLGDGRDATECAINRGIVLGGGWQNQEILAQVNHVPSNQ